MPMGDGPNEGGASRIHILSQIDLSLKRLVTDHLDLYWVHAWDGVTPMDETVEVMSNLVKAGKIRYWGVSNYGGWQLATTAMIAKAPGFVPPIAQQINYTPEAREAEYEIIPAAEAHGIGTMIWSPLGQGLLTGKIDRNTEPPQGTRQGSTWTEPFVIDKEKAFRVIDALEAVADETGVSVPQVVLAWLRDRPSIGSIVIGARTEDQLRDNLASYDVSLSDEQADRIEEAGRPLAIYPFWHRAQHSIDRPGPAEKDYLKGWRKSQGLDPA
jgi:aryl-alcohol dehydrogenase-like predicted oxidoreductase